MQISFSQNKEQLLKKIFNVDDLTEILQKVANDWSDMQISLKAGNLTIDEKIEVLEAKEKPKDIIIGKIKSKKLK